MGHTGRSLQGSLLALLDGESRQALGRLGTILEWEHNRMHCYNNHSLLPKCGWQSRPLRPLSPHCSFILASSPLVHLASNFGRPHGVKNCTVFALLVPAGARTGPFLVRALTTLRLAPRNYRPKSSSMGTFRSLVAVWGSQAREPTHREPSQAEPRGQSPVRAWHSRRACLARKA